MKHIFRFSIITLLFFSCSHGLKIVFHQSDYQNFIYNSFQLPKWHQLFADSLINITGIYNIDARNKSFQLNIYDLQGKFMRIPLAEALPFENNSLISLKAKIRQKQESLRYISHPIVIHEAQPVEYNLLSDLSEIKTKITQKYWELLPEIQKQITPRESKLRLNRKTAWEFFYKEHDNEIIALSLQNDLMYQAVIEFFIDLKSGKIKKVQANEWFKGEI